MLPRSKLPPPLAGPLLTGHFRERLGYGTVRERGTGDWLLILTVSGGGRFGHRGGEIRAAPGDAVLLAPGAHHDYSVDPALRQWELLWAHFIAPREWLDLLDWPQEAPGLMRLRLNDPAALADLVARFAEVNRLATGALRRREQFAMNALEDVLLRCDLANPASAQAHLDPRVRGTMDYLCEHLAERITLATLAHHARLSVSRLAHLFRQQVGTTPQQFLERQRLGRAQQLLVATHRPIQAIAAEVGFDNPFYFSLRFKRMYKLGPRAYRQRRLGESG